jgi:hypothetical protein
MALIGRIARVAYKMTPKRKAALAKAVAASAKKRGSKSAVKKAAPKISRKVKKATARKTAISKTNKLNLKRTKTGSIDKSNFKGKSGKAIRKATYKTRLASSRAKFKESGGGKSFGERRISRGGRRQYVDLTKGENIRRNLARSAKLSATGATIFAGGSYAALAAEAKRAQKRLQKLNKK